MKIVLVYIDHWEKDNHQRIAGSDFFYGKLVTNFPMISESVDLPLGLASIRAYSRQDPLIKSACQFINRIYVDTLSSEAMADDILSQGPDLAAFSTHVWNFERTKRVCEIIKSKRQGIKIVLGGPMVPDDVVSNKKMLKANKGIDALIRGQGEIAFRQLLRYYLKKEDARHIPNTVLREGDEVFINTARVSVSNLAELPSPYLSGDVVIQDNATGMLALETSRGCMFDCAYCRYHGGERPRSFNIERVKQEIAILKNKGFKGNVIITDPLFNFDKKWAKSVLRILEGVDFTVEIALRPELIDDEMIKMFARIPRLECGLGIQSINPVALRNINRSTNIVQCREVIQKLAKSQVRMDIGLIIGLPGDTYETFRKTIDWTVYCGVKQISVNDLLILPNSNLERMSEKFGIKYNSQCLELSNDTFSEADMVKASHFKICFLFLFRGYQRIFHMLIFEYRFKPSDVVDRLIEAAQKKGEIPCGRLVGLNGINFSKLTILRFLRSLFDDRQSVEYFFSLFREDALRFKEDEP